MVYAALGLYLFPGVLTDPLVYDMGVAFLPVSFYVMGILAGGVATVMKKGVGLDLRGRMLEIVVVVMTLWLFQVTWGVVWAFFGDASMCMGLLGTSSSEEVQKTPMLLQILRQGLFRPAQAWVLFWDRLSLQTPPLVRKSLCRRPLEDLNNSTTCFPHVPHVDFFQEEPKCASDMELVGSLWVLAGAVLVATTFWKKHERRARARVRAARRGRHLHED